MEDKNKKYDFQIAKINQKLRELKEFELFLLILKIDEKKENRFELYKEVIKAKKQLFNVLQQYFDIKYSEFNRIPYILFSNNNLIMIKRKFLYFYKEFSLIVEPLKKEIIHIDFKEEKKIEITFKDTNSNFSEDDNENEWDDSNMNLNSIQYIKQSDTTNKYNANLTFDYSSSNSNINDF